MEIWLDTCDLEAVHLAKRMGILHGVTTNPKILSSTRLPLAQILSEILDAQEGPVAAQVMADKTEDMLKEADALLSISTRILPKIAVTPEGLKAIHILISEDIPVMATAIVTPQQGLLAFSAGATYLAPYLGRAADAGQNEIDLLTAMHRFQQNYSYSGKILAAGLRSLDHLLFAATLGISGVTLPLPIFQQFIEIPQATELALADFSKALSQ